jgi:hypothetical protein
MKNWHKIIEKIANMSCSQKCCKGTFWQDIPSKPNTLSTGVRVWPNLFHHSGAVPCRTSIVRNHLYHYIDINKPAFSYLSILFHVVNILKNVWIELRCLDFFLWCSGNGWCDVMCPISSSGLCLGQFRNTTNTYNNNNSFWFRQGFLHLNSPWFRL